MSEGKYEWYILKVNSTDTELSIFSEARKQLQVVAKFKVLNSF
jgi:hypothetical protein